MQTLPNFTNKLPTSEPRSADLAALHARRLDSLALSLELLKNLQPSQSLPHLLPYLPWNEEENNIRRFNCTGELPRDLDNAEDISLWILQQTQLSRLRLSDFLCSDSMLAQSVLSELAKKICSLDAAQSFVDGLVYFLSITGIWERAISLTTNKRQEPSSSSSSSSSSFQLLSQQLASCRDALCVFCAAHSELSSRSLIPSFSTLTTTAQARASALVSLTSLSLLLLSLLLSQNESTSTSGRLTPISMSDFLAQLKAMHLLLPGGPLSLTQRQVQELLHQVSTATVVSISAVAAASMMQPQPITRDGALLTGPFAFRGKCQVYMVPSNHPYQQQKQQQMRQNPMNYSNNNSSVHREDEEVAGNVVFFEGDVVVYGNALYLFEPTTPTPTTVSNKNHVLQGRSRHSSRRSRNQQRINGEYSAAVEEDYGEEWYSGNDFDEEDDEEEDEDEEEDTAEAGAKLGHMRYILPLSQLPHDRPKAAGDTAGEGLPEPFVYLSQSSSLPYTDLLLSQNQHKNQPPIHPASVLSLHPAWPNTEILLFACAPLLTSTTTSTTTMARDEGEGRTSFAGVKRCVGVHLSCCVQQHSKQAKTKVKATHSRPALENMLRLYDALSEALLYTPSLSGNNMDSTAAVATTAIPTNSTSTATNMLGEKNVSLVSTTGTVVGDSQEDDRLTTERKKSIPSLLISTAGTNSSSNTHNNNTNGNNNSHSASTPTSAAAVAASAGGEKDAQGDKHTTPTNHSAVNLLFG